MASLKRPCGYPEMIDIAVAESATDTPQPTWTTALIDLQNTTVGETLGIQISRTVGSIENRKKAAVGYFRTTHQWLPFIDEGAYFVHLEATHGKEHLNPHFGLLSLCLLLIGIVPTHGEMSERMTALYIFAKGAVTTLSDTDACSLELLQCRLILTVFEAGHALYPAAYVSTGSNIRAAEAMGIDAESSPEVRSRATTSPQGRMGEHIWDAMVIMRRYVSSHLSAVAITIQHIKSVIDC